MTPLYLVRHGQSEWNRAGRIQGRNDSPLTTLGIEQAHAIGRGLAPMLAGHPIRVWSSPLGRARETAAIVCGYVDAHRPVSVDARLNDFDLGEIGGYPGWDRVAADFPDLARLRLEDPYRFHPAGGESGADMAARLTEFLDDLPDDGVASVVVSHGVVNKFIRSLRRGIKGAGIIALGESQNTVYRLDEDIESAIELEPEREVSLMPTVDVALGERSYPIIIEPGLLERSAPYLAPVIDGRRVAVITDATVEGALLPRLTPALDAVSPHWNRYLVHGGEGAKSFAGVEAVLDAMLEDGVDRASVVVAFGGGVVGDVGGFAAALLMRGIEFVQIPTTLMSQVDSAVGGKNGINTRQGKNLVGAFLQPRIVLNDVSVLRSLPPGEMRSGYGEIIKCALLRGETEFSWLEKNGAAVLEQVTPALVEAVRLGCETKARVVADDERDRGKRAWVNLGHTFAHAFEAQAGFGAMPHGAAVAVGLVAATALSVKIGQCAPQVARRVREHVAAMGLAIDLRSLSQAVTWNADTLYAHMQHDKKTVAGRINFVLLDGFGKPVVTPDVARTDVIDALRALGAD